MRIRIGVLGCAAIARRRMLPAMVASPDVEVVAVASRDADKAKAVAREFECLPVLGYAGLVEREDIDAVYAPVPAALHGEWVEAALRAGKHVLAEKPLTTDLGHTRALVELARRSGLALVENVMFVHHGQQRAVRRLLAEGRIGELRSIHATYTIPRLPEDDIRYNPRLGGGALWDIALYPVRTAQYFLAGKLTVCGAVLSGTPVDTLGAALLRTQSGVVAQLTFGLDHAYESSYELRGTEGSITVDRAYSPPADLVPIVHCGGERIPLPPDDQVANSVAAFVAAVRNGTAFDDESLRQAELLDEIGSLARR
ncbi:Gfo/Idh/MocA family protein [Actinosynnema sp. CS-041913]|uniref:Gfo/Idh/MocA family protein n=1 Tax=Actinosynnema sp. CS-041913 TaxID=3239917 RepID=UPI003D90718F